MPDPNDYENEADFMAACVPMRMDEGDTNEQAVGACMGMWRNKSVNCLKAVEKTEDELRVRNYIILFGGRDLEGLGSRRQNADGSIGEFFSKNVDVESPYTKAGTFHIDWEHGRDKDEIGNNPDEVLGFVDWKTAQRDDKGIIVDRVLSRRAKYMEWLEDLIDAGLVGTSSMPTAKGTQKKANGEIVRWPLYRDTLTVMPMEPRMMSENVLKAYKALELIPSEEETGAEPPVQDDQKPPEKAKENTDMEEKDVKAMLDEYSKTLNETLVKDKEENQKAVLDAVEKQAETTAQKTVEEFLNKLPEVKAAMNGKVEVTEAEEDKEFKSIGANCIAVANYVKRGELAPRIRGLQAKSIAAAVADGNEKAIEAAYKAALGSNELIPSQGEFLLEPTITRELLKPMHESGVFSTKVRRLPVGPNSNSGWIPGVDETSRADGSRWGGVRGYHLEEAGTKTASQPKFRKINWELHKVAVLQYATDELLRDAGMLTAIIQQSSAEEIDFMVNDDILNGAGGDRPLGVLNSGCLISPSRVTLLQVNHTDIITMWQRLHPRFRAGAEWYINSEVEPQLNRLAFTSNAATTEMMSPYVNYGPNGVLRMMGRPVNVTEFNAALGTAGDILLANFSDYLFWEKGAIEAAMSIHVQFLTDQTAFRFVARYDGQTALASAITPYKGTNTQSPFVALLATT